MHPLHIESVSTLPTSPFLLAAKFYLKRGWPVFPLRQGLKTPATLQGFKNASTDFLQIEQWFETGEYNLGIATGNGLLVLDIDRKAGKDGNIVIQQLEAVYGVLPETLTIATPTGGEHRYFSYDPSLTISSKANIYKEYGEGLDIRADGGYVVAPPSITNAKADPSGRTTSGFYATSKKTSVAALPIAWIQLLTSKPKVATPVPYTASDASLIDDVQSALNYIPADDYDLWIAIGKACYSLGNQGFTLWDTWSKTSSKYQVQEMPSKWQSFNSGHAYTPAFIFDQAAKSGWENPAKQTGWEQTLTPQINAKEPNRWLTPDPLIEGSRSLPYPIHALPDLLGAAVKEVVDIVKCPPAIAAGSALAVLATVIQGIADVQYHRGLKPSPLSLYTMTIAESGERKTTADNFFSCSLADWENTLELELAGQLASDRAEHSSWKLKKSGQAKAIEKATERGEDTTNLELKLIQLETEEPEVVRCPSLVLEDTTPEAVVYHLASTWAAIGILSSEAGIVFGGHGMRAENIQRNLAMLNKLWEGGEIKVNRRGSENYKVRNARFSMGIAAQPSMIQAFYDHNGVLARGSGFFARFLIAAPETTQGKRFLRSEELNTTHAKLALNSFNERLKELLNQHYVNGKDGNFENLPTLYLDAEATQVWLAYFNAVEAEQRFGGDMEHARDVASKSADNAARLAGIFHIVNGGDTLDPINSATMRVACELASWYLYESRRFFGELALPEDLSHAVMLDAWLIKHCQSKNIKSINKRHLMQYAPNRLRDSKKLEAALKILQSANRIRAIEKGRASIYEINPALLGEQANGA